MQRLDKVLADALNWTRSDIRNAIKQKRVSVKHHIVSDFGVKVSQHDHIMFDDEQVNLVHHEIIMVHKPIGVVCSSVDPKYPTVFEYFKLSPKLYHMVGRLDQDTSGLLLLTTNGQLTHQLMNPAKKVEKHYQVVLREPISHKAIQQLESGVDIGDEKACEPAKVVVMDATTIVLIIHEGRYHQVKRMLQAVKNEVLELHRSQIGSLTLDGVEVGSWRECTKEEIMSLKQG